VCIDASSHCRLVDDSKLLTKKPNAGSPPDSCCNLPAVNAASVPTSSDTTHPKMADTDVQASNVTASLNTNASLEPLLSPRPDVSYQTP